MCKPCCCPDNNFSSCRQCEGWQTEEYARDCVVCRPDNIHCREVLLREAMSRIQHTNVGDVKKYSHLVNIRYHEIRATGGVMSIKEIQSFLEVYCPLKMREKTPK